MLPQRLGACALPAALCWLGAADGRPPAPPQVPLVPAEGALGAQGADAASWEDFQVCEGRAAAFVACAESCATPAATLRMPKLTQQSHPLHHAGATGGDSGSACGRQPAGGGAAPAAGHDQAVRWGGLPCVRASGCQGALGRGWAMRGAVPNACMHGRCPGSAQSSILNLRQAV